MSFVLAPGLRGFGDPMRGLDGDRSRAVEAEEFSAGVLNLHDTIRHEGQAACPMVFIGFRGAKAHHNRPEGKRGIELSIRLKPLWMFVCRGKRG